MKAFHVSFKQGATVDSILEALSGLDGKMTVFTADAATDPRTGERMVGVGFTDYPPPETPGVVRFRA